MILAVSENTAALLNSSLSSELEADSLLSSFGMPVSAADLVALPKLLSFSFAAGLSSLEAVDSCSEISMVTPAT